MLPARYPPQIKRYTWTERNGKIYVLKMKKKKEKSQGNNTYTRQNRF